MAQQGTPYPIRLGQQGQVTREHRHLIQSGDLEIAENVVYEHDVLRLQPTTAVYDIDAGVDFTLGFHLSATQTVVGDVVFLAGDPLIPMTLVHATSVQATSSSPTDAWTVTLASGATTSQSQILAIAWAAATPVTVVSVTDSSNNTWVRLTAEADDTGTFQTALWMVRPTTLLVGGVSTVTVHFSAAPTRALLWGQRWAGVTTTVVDRTAFGPASVGGATTLIHMARYMRREAANTLIVAPMAWNSTTADLTWDASTGPVLTDPGNLTGASERLTIGRSILDIFLTLAQTSWDSDVLLTSASTVAITAGSTTVTGTLTSFSAIYQGAEMTINGESHFIDTVTSTTLLTTTTPWRQTISGVIYRLHVPSRLVTVYGDFGSQVALVYKSTARPVSTEPNQGFLTADNLAVGLAVDMRHPRFIAGGKETSGAPKKLFLASGTDPVQVLSGDGTTMTAIATPAADWDTVQNPHKQPINGIVHRNQLILFGNWNDPHRIYFADPADHEVFQGGDATQMRIASQIGERLYGAAEYQGILYLWKHPRGIFYLDDTDIDFVNWAYHIRSAALGCAPNPYAVLSIDDDVIFMAPDGHVHRLSAVNTLGGTSDSDLTLALGLDHWTRDNLDLTRLDTLASCWDPKLRTAYFGVKSTANRGARNDLTLMFDFALVPRGGPVRFSYATVWSPNSLCLFDRDINGEPALMVGEYETSFFVVPGSYGSRFDRAVGTGASDPVAVGHPHRVRTSRYDCGDQQEVVRPKYKHYRLLVVSWAVAPTSDLTAAIYVDNVLKQSIPLPRTPFSQITLACGRGHDFAIEVTDAGDEPIDPRYLAFTVYYDVGGEQAAVA